MIATNTKTLLPENALGTGLLQKPENVCDMYKASGRQPGEGGGTEP